MTRDKIERILWTFIEAAAGIVSAAGVATILMAAGVPADLWGITTVGLTPICAALLAWVKVVAAQHIGAQSPALWPNAKHAAP